LPSVIKKKRWTSMLDYYGNRTRRYYAAQKLCAEIHGLGREFMTFAAGWKGVMPVNGSLSIKPCAAFDMLETPLKSVKGLTVSAENDAIVGVFVRTDGKKAYMITDYTVPAYRKKNRVEIKFDGAKTISVYVKGKKKTFAAENGAIRLILSAGEGVFVIPD
ncbi:MAG: hypothetical protein J6Y43_01580, partial [Clostridia bacterium]|nr:hypothetical protein [Clostridia bacterium]